MKWKMDEKWMKNEMKNWISDSGKRFLNTNLLSHPIPEAGKYPGKLWSRFLVPHHHQVLLQEPRSRLRFLVISRFLHCVWTFPLLLLPRYGYCHSIPLIIACWFKDSHQYKHRFKSFVNGKSGKNGLAQQKWNVWKSHAESLSLLCTRTRWKIKH